MLTVQCSRVGEALGVEAGLSSSGSDRVTVGTPFEPTLRTFSQSKTLVGAGRCWGSALAGAVLDSVRVIDLYGTGLRSAPQVPVGAVV